MEIHFKRHVFGIMVIPIGRCDCDQDYCLVCEIKFVGLGRFVWHIIRKGM